MSKPNEGAELAKNLRPDLDSAYFRIPITTYCLTILQDISFSKKYYFNFELSSPTLRGDNASFSLGLTFFRITKSHKCMFGFITGKIGRSTSRTYKNMQALSIQLSLGLNSLINLNKGCVSVSYIRRHCRCHGTPFFQQLSEKLFGFSQNPARISNE